jgi:hypothetical protein
MGRAAAVTNSEFRSWLDEVMQLVPEGDFEQNLFRSVLHCSLAGAYAQDSRGPVSDVVGQSIELVRDDYPEFAPRFSSALRRADWPTRLPDERDRLKAASTTFLKLR